MVEKVLRYRLDTIPACDRRRDRRTDGFVAVAKTTLYYASRG